MTVALASLGRSAVSRPASLNPTAAYWARYLCKQASGNVVDSSGNNRTAVLDADLVTAGNAWTANAGYFTCLNDAAGGNGGATVPNSQIDISYGIHSLVMMCRALIPSSVTAQEQIMGYGGGAVAGITMQKRPTGHELQLRLNRGTSTSYGVATGTALNDDVFHTLIMAVDGPAQIGFGWVDGVAQFTGTALAASGSGSGRPDAAGFGFGHEGIGSGTTIPIQFDVIQIFKFIGNLPAQLARGVAFLTRSPYEIMPESIWPVS